MNKIRKKQELITQIHTLNHELISLLENELVAAPFSDICNQEPPLSLQSSIKDLLISLSCDMYWDYDPLINRMKFSKPFSEDIGWVDLSEVSLTKFLDFVPIAYRKTIIQSFHNLMQKQTKVEEFDYQFVRKDGTKDWYHAKCSYITDENDAVIRIIGINNNITKSKLKNEMIAQEQAKNELLISFSNNYIWEYDCEEDCFTANNSLYDILGLSHRKYSYEEIIKLHEEETPPNLKDAIGLMRLSGSSTIHLYSAREKAYLIFEVNYGGLRDSEGNVYRIIGTLDDVTEKEMLMATAARDPLTNAYNRRMGNLRLRSSFDRYKENGEFFTIVFFDVDHFKTVNDKYGHDMGDYVLKAVCETISKEVRSTDMLFRWGGDELLLVCSGIMKENIYANIDRIRNIIENTKYEYAGEVLNLTVSIGAAYFYKSDTDEQQAVKRADRSLYKAKLAGRNKACILL